MRPGALIYLEEDSDAQRLVMAWPLLTHAARLKLPSPAAIRLWAHVAAVSELAAEHLSAPLLLHELVRADGTIDPLAEAYIARRFEEKNKGPLPGQEPAAPPDAPASA